MVDLALSFLTGAIDLILNTELSLFVGLALVLTILGFIYKLILNN